MAISRIQVGKKGEDIASAYLIKNGYTIIKKNYKNSFGEVDIIAQEKDVTVFIEIKTRLDNLLLFGPPQIAVTPKKQKKIIKTSIVYIKQNKIINTRFRFDVIAITLLPDGILKKNGIKQFKNAFQAEGY